MQTALQPNQTPSQWEEALAFYKSRGHVLFISHQMRFWDRHGFVQQSLAKVLTDHGVRVTWIDGSGWRPIKPVLQWKSPLLNVYSLFELPFRRFRVISELNDFLVARYLNRLIRRLGNPVVWVEAALKVRVVEQLKRVDVYSVFDDPYCHNPDDALCKKARLITCQNRHAFNRFYKQWPDKTQLLLPPVELNKESFEESKKLELPHGFPKKIMGYVGSLPGEGTDFVLFERLLNKFKDRGLLLVGAADTLGMSWIEKLRKYPNFHYIPWVERRVLASVWKSLSVSLLFYRPAKTNDGAFPVKALEGLHFGVPSLCTNVPKTQDLDKFFYCSSFPGEIEERIEKEMYLKVPLKEAYESLLLRMHPKFHLSEVAKCLKS